MRAVCRELFGGNYADDTISHSPKQTHTRARPLSFNGGSLRNTQRAGDTSQMMSRASPQNRRDQRLQTEALRITHLDLFHNAPVTRVGGWWGGRGVRRLGGGATHLLSHMESILREPSPISGWLIAVTNEDLQKKSNAINDPWLACGISCCARVSTPQTEGIFLEFTKISQLAALCVFSPL